MPVTNQAVVRVSTVSPCSTRTEYHQQHPQYAFFFTFVDYSIDMYVYVRTWQGFVDKGSLGENNSDS